MITRLRFPTLFDDNNVSLTNNGYGLLKDAIQCEVTEEQNGSYELELQYPLDGVLAEKLDWQMIIRALPNLEQDEQLFRIYDVKKSTNNDVLTIKARHITNDLTKCFVEKLEITDASQSGALDALQHAGNYVPPFTLRSDKDTKSSTTLERVSMLSAFAGTQGSILDHWGGEIIRDNYTLSMNNRRGRDNGLKILYRKNLNGLEMAVDASSITIAIFPFAQKDDKLITLDGDKYIKSENYDLIKAGQTLAVDFSSDDTVTDPATLLAASKDYFKSHNAEPTLNIKVEFEQFQQSDQYDKFKNLERVGMGDTVYCFYPPLNVDVSGRVVKYVFDSINQEYTSLEVGALKSNFIDNINKAVDNVVNNSVKPTDMDKAINDVTNAITGNDGGYVVLYPPKNPEEIYIMDAPDVNKANHVLRMNKNGIGFSKTGINGPFKTGWTIDGQFVADFITTGKLNADLIKAGAIRAIDIIGSTITGSIFKTDGTNGFATTIQNGAVSFLKNGKEIAYFGAVTDRATNAPNGVAWYNEPGQSIGLNQSNADGTVSHPLISVPTDSTYENPFWQISGAFRGSLTSTQDDLWVSARQHLMFSGNNGAGNQLNVYGDRVEVLGNFTVYNGSKNAAHVTRDGLRATPAYETTESYLGDIGEANTGEQSSVTVPIDELFGDTVNTARDYQVFITPYTSAHVWVSERNTDSFTVTSSEPNAQFGWELKAKRRGYEDERLTKMPMTYGELKKMIEGEEKND